MMTRLTTLARIGLVATLLAVAGCSTGGGGLSAGLTARMDQSGAQLNRGEALGIINAYRSTVGAGPLTEDATLNATAATMASNYAKTGRQAPKPEGTLEIRYSAGYATFAETFSGWRNSGQESIAMSGPSATRAGIAVVYEENSPYGVYWVVIVG
ncbi:MAG: CAP domain-containing protein [Hyphomicrobiales bacterium]|nr:MAG: CAP domain-containing protein [Hyphomicrobiales bacterium]